VRIVVALSSRLLVHVFLLPYFTFLWSLLHLLPNQIFSRLNGSALGSSRRGDLRYIFSGDSSPFTRGSRRFQTCQLISVISPRRSNDLRRFLKSAPSNGVSSMRTGWGRTKPVSLRFARIP